MYAWEKDSDKLVIKIQKLLSKHAQVFDQEFKNFCYQEVDTYRASQFYWDRRLRLDGENFGIHTWASTSKKILSLNLIYMSSTEWAKPSGKYSVAYRIATNRSARRKCTPSQGGLLIRNFLVDKEEEGPGITSLLIQDAFKDMFTSREWVVGPQVDPDGFYVLLEPSKKTCLSCPNVLPCKIKYLDV